ncbi:hypothetical protein NQ117_14935 [Paenibacillus sp. SC116]|uniref:hypothetical protein n=1 Tax=Paenibacillus sp. SC116 TaxID=2968986 RepID=UPI00215B18F4|nr:hypothetical protein [Paenibacillus sp. SC116]MCR8844975.1 hypothetical protein [Paenibacillus sp. SC116]
MQDAIVWGSLIIKYSYIAFAFSALAAYIAMKYWLKDSSELNSSILEDITDISFWALLTWKFSTLIFNPVQVFNNLYYLLYFNGGDRGMWLAAIIAFIFLTIKSKKRGVSGWIYAATVATGLLAYKLIDAMFHLLFSSTVQTALSDLTSFFLTLTLMIWMYISKENFRRPHEICQLILWFSIGKIFISFLQNERSVVFLGLSKEQLLFLALAVSCLFLQNFKMKGNFKVS